MKDVLYIVIPAYNEEEIIADSIEIISDKLKKLIKIKKVNRNSKILIVDDGSQDNTFKILKSICASNKLISIIKLSRNCGHQSAMYAGLMESIIDADMVISMDADLQDDINVIDKMIEEYYKGNDIVYGVRNDRKSDSFFKEKSAILFYKFMSFLGVDIIYNHADFRLMSKRSLEALSRYEETNLFLRGIIPMLGFKSSKVYYSRKKRIGGLTKYNLNKMIKLAMDGVTSFSIRPIRLIIGIGFISSFMSFLYLIYVIVGKLMNFNYVTGWASIVALICCFGSFQILCSGVIGEYISKIYLETKRRPKYIFEDKIK